MGRSVFRIRYTRTRGLASLFESPSNGYRWSGRGTLRIDPLGVHFAARRRGLGLPRLETRLVALSQIRDVYRQAESVRLHFEDESRHASLVFWADDAAAALIVEQVPTWCAVESDIASEIPAAPLKAASRIRAFAVPVVVLGVAMLGARLIAKRFNGAGDRSAYGCARRGFGALHFFFHAAGAEALGGRAGTAASRLEAVRRP